MSDVWSEVADALAAAGCAAVVGLPTDEPGLLDAAARHPRLTALRVRDHRVGACAAAGHAAVDGRPVVLASSVGPAFSSALAGLVEAASASLPIVVATTSVATAERGRGAFQELDQAAIASAFAKDHVVVERPELLAWAVRRAVRQAVSGCPGVVVLELAHELLCAPSLPAARTSAGGPVEAVVAPTCTPVDGDLARAAALLAGARTPLLVAGGGARLAGAGSALARLLHAWPAARATTASGRGTLSEQHELACGLVGLYVTPPLDAVLGEADVVLAVGTRFEETMRMGWRGLADATLIQVDVDPGAFGRALEPAVALHGDAAATCDALAVRLAGAVDLASASAWHARVASARREAARRLAAPTFAAAPTRAVLAAVSRAFVHPVIVQENGLHDLWGFHYPLMQAGAGTTFVAPGEQTAMGFGVSAALGAAVAAPERTVIATCGDGALEMALPALASMVEHRCRTLLVVFDNGGLGWPRLLRRAAGVPSALADTAPASAPAAVAAFRELGGHAATVTSAAELTAALATARERLRERVPCMLHVPVDDRDLSPSAQMAVAA